MADEVHGPWQAMVLEFGDRGPKLTIRPKGAGTGPMVRLRRNGHRWRVPGEPPDGDGGGKVGPASLLVRPDGGHREAHPDLEAEVLVVEGNGREGLCLEFAWDGGEPKPWAEGLFSKDGGIRHGQVGTGWIRYGGARLGIHVVPRHFVHESPASVADAIRDLGALVRDLASIGRSLHQPSDRERPDQLGVPVQEAEQRKLLWYQRLARLEHLVRDKGVRDAWQALMADPVVVLEQHFPSAFLAEARRPVLAGARGPWSLPRGWSPDSPHGIVRERVVRRTADTPPNRLAVALARKVIEELASIQRAAAGAGERLAGTGLGCLVEDLLVEAEAVLLCPAFAEVPPDALAPLDSPSVLVTPRCQPLLHAWTALDRGLALSLDVPVGDVMIEPLARMEVLYERWCFALLCQIAGGVLKAPEPANLDDPNGKLLHRKYRSSNGDVIEILHAADGAPAADDKDRPAGRWIGTGEKAENRTWKNRVTSWSPVLRPDGFLIVNGHVHVWDAKYRRWLTTENNRWESGRLYQAHAFRDALTFDGKPIEWSIAIHPMIGSSGSKTYPRPANGAVGGVGTVPASPGARQHVDNFIRDYMMGRA